MVFPVNYKLGEKEDNLSVKFKLLTNKREMFEAELPCLGKKRAATQHTWELYISLHSQVPKSTSGAMPSVGTGLHMALTQRQILKQDGLHGCPIPCWPGRCLPSAPLSDWQLRDSIVQAAVGMPTA